MKTGSTGADTDSVEGTDHSKVESGSAADVPVVAANVHSRTLDLSDGDVTVEIGEYEVQCRNMLWDGLLAQEAQKNAEYDCM